MHNHWGCFVSGTSAMANDFSGINLGIKRRGQLVVPRKAALVSAAYARASDSTRLYLKTNRHRAHRLCQSMYANQICAGLSIRAHILKRDTS